MDPLDVLKVIDRLEVGPIQLEKRRLTAKYRVSRLGQSETRELIYKFEEDVFAPHTPACRNLAEMMAVQVALNYGHFCEEIVFVGRFDKNDQRFIRDMARNTAREIYVKKFLEPNPFLRGAAAKLPMIKKESYLSANLMFKENDAPSNASSEYGPVWKKREEEASRYAVLFQRRKRQPVEFWSVE